MFQTISKKYYIYDIRSVSDTVARYV